VHTLPSVGQRSLRRLAASRPGRTAAHRRASHPGRFSLD